MNFKKGVKSIQTADYSGARTVAYLIQKHSFSIITWPGGAPLSNLIGLYLVDTLSRGEWADGRMETAARAIVTRAIAAMKKQ